MSAADLQRFKSTNVLTMLYDYFKNVAGGRFQCQISISLPSIAVDLNCD